MGRLVDGEWQTNADQMTSDSDEFEREPTQFRDRVDPGDDTRFDPEPGRYHLYVSYACPWAHRTVATRAILGLEDVVTVDVVDPHRQDHGWAFSPDRPNCTTDSIHDADYLYEVYTAADPDYTGHVSVPVLWDRETATIVNNESEEIIKQFATAFQPLAATAVDLYPPALQDDIDAVIDDIYPTINNGVYKAGFADSQSAYDDAVHTLFDALDRYNDRLADDRYLLGEPLTLADICLFTTLYRFDEVYHTHFKCNHRHITDYHHLWNYLKALYQLPGVADTCYMDHIKEHYYRSHTDLNPSGHIPIGPDPAFDADHDRDTLTGDPPTTHPTD